MDLFPPFDIPERREKLLREIVAATGDTIPFEKAHSHCTINLGGMTDRARFERLRRVLEMMIHDLRSET